ncbi:MAG: NusG domain II-containing protein [Clostridium sp.]|nr:NusG domain II-containing protein [Clostridium sp.]MCM1171361.1 NusG domain II-containing protein [Clostridium sp.]MCM1208409.1 NusG domain II-containing protein [Ruminococcus sp.]
MSKPETVTDNQIVQTERAKRSFLKRYKSDIILIVIVLFVGAGALMVQRLSMKTGGTVKVYIDGTEVKRFSLDEDTEYKIVAASGGGERSEDADGLEEYNILVIKSGSAYISESDCHEQICVKHSAISKAGETIVCLPHSLVIEVE